MKNPIQGAGGSGGGGGGHTAYEAPNTLQSTQHASILDVISEGPIKGFVQQNPLASIYLNDTPVVDPSTGVENFPGVVLDYRLGTQDQTHISGFSEVESETAVAVQVQQATPTVRSVVNTELDAVRVTLSTPQLNLATAEGDLIGTSFDYMIELQCNGGGYKPVPVELRFVDTTLTGSPVTELVTDSTSYGISANFGVLVPLSSTATVRWQYKSPADATWQTLSDKTYTPNAKTVNNRDGTTVTNSDNDVVITPTVQDIQGVWRLRAVVLSGSPTITIKSGKKAYWSTTGSFSGKCTSKYQRSIVVDVHKLYPNQTGPWDVRVTRITADSASSNLRNDLYWDSYTTIIYAKLRYPNSALTFLDLNSKTFNAMPTRGYEVYGMLVKIPSNYNPYTRNYTGVWDGTFQVEWTDNPAWVLYDILTNKRYGLGKYIDSDLIDKWALYDIAQYCDGVDGSGNYVGVDDGRGGKEPRFTCNAYLQTKQEAYTLVGYLVSVFRGQTYMASGTVFATADRDSDPVALFTQANVTDGDFNYSGTSRKARHTVALVSWNDPSNKYKSKVEYVEDPDAIRKYGVNELDATAFGCTSRGQAMRFGKWLLYSEQHETETVTFTTGLNGVSCYPGSVIKTIDTNRLGARHGGRLVSGDTLNLTLDAQVTLSPGNAYTLLLMLPDGTVESRPIVNSTSTTDQLVAASSFTMAPNPGAIWVLEAQNLKGELWRVLAITEVEPLQYSITAIEHNPSKYAAVESGNALIDYPTSVIAQVSQPATNLVVTDTLYLSGLKTVATKIHMSWQGTGVSYDVSWRPQNGNWSTFRVSSNTAEILPVSEVPHELKIVSIDGLGRKSVELTTTYTVIGKTAAPSAVTGLTATLSSSGVDLTWNGIPDLDLDFYEVRIGASVMQRVSATRWQYPLTPLGTTTFSVFACDTSGNYSTEVTVNQTINAPSTPTLSGAFSGQDVVLTTTPGAVNASNQLPIKSYTVKHGSSFATGTLVSDGLADTTKVRADFAGARQYWVVVTDVAGNTSTPSSVSVTVSAPAAPVLSYGFSGESLVLSWTTPAASLSIQEYEVRQGATWETATPVATVSANTLTRPVDWTSATFRVKAKDTAGNYGSEGTLTISSTAATVSGVTAQFQGNQVLVKWSGTAGSVPIREYEIRTGASWAAGQFVAKSLTTSVLLAANWSGTQTFWIAAIDVSGASGTPVSRTLALVVPGASAPSAVLSQADVRISWPASSTGSLPIAGYRLKHGGVYATGEDIAVTDSTSYTLPVSWVGNRTFWVAPIDVNGNEGPASSTVVTVNAPSAVTTFTSQIIAAKASLSWVAPVSNLPIKEYVIKSGAAGFAWASGQLVIRISALNFRVPIDWVGDRSFKIAAVDINGNEGAVSGDLTVAVAAPLAPSVSCDFIGSSVSVTWTMPTSTLPIEEYEVWHTSVSPTNSLGRVKGTMLAVPVSWVGSRNFHVAAYNVNGNIGATGSTSINVTAPSAPALSGQVLDNNVLLYWSGSVGSLPVNTYEVRKGATWETSTLIGQKSGGFTTIFETVSGNYTYWVAGIDTAGNYGTPAPRTLSVSQPPDYVLKVDENLDIGNTVYRWDFTNTIHGWSITNGTFVAGSTAATYTATAIDPQLRLTGLALHGSTRTRVRAQITRLVGSTWEGTVYYSTAGHGESASYYKTISGSLAVGASAIFEWDMAALTAGGSDWVDSVITGIRLDLTHTNGESFLVDWIEILPPIAASIVFDAGTPLMPVNVVETFQAHFTNNSWATPQAQVNAGYPVFAQPGNLTGYYEEVIDYGAVLTASKITVSYGGTVVSGTPTVTPRISVKLNLGDAWTDYDNMSSVFATNFRYAKVRITVTGTATALYRLNTANIRIDSKMINDAGSLNTSLGGAHAQANLINYRNWVAGMNMPPSGTSYLGTLAMNSIVSAAGPSGVNEPLWQFTPDGATSSSYDGGYTYANVPVDKTKKTLVAAFVKRGSSATAANSCYLRTSSNSASGPNGLLTIAGAAQQNCDALWTASTAGSWFLAVQLIHENGYAGSDNNVSGIYALNGTRSIAAAEFKMPSDVTTITEHVAQWQQQTDVTANAWSCRPFIKQVSTVTEAQDLISYLLRCATKYGGEAVFNVPILDVSSIVVTPGGSATPVIPMYDFYDAPSPTRFNVFLYTLAGAEAAGSASWAVKGY